MLRIMTFILSTFTLLTSVCAQENCLEQIKAAYNKVYQISESELKEDQSYYLNLLTKVSYFDEALPPEEVSQKVWTSSKNVKLVTPEIDFYQDEKDQFLVFKKEKAIYRYAALPLKKPFPNDSLLKHASVTGCEVKEQGKEVTLHIDEVHQNRLTVTGLVYQLDTVNNTIQKITLHHKKQEGQAQQTSEYHFLEQGIINWGKENFLPVSKQFLSNDQLKKQWASYKYINMTQTAKK